MIGTLGEDVALPESRVSRFVRNDDLCFQGWIYWKLVRGLFSSRFILLALGFWKRFLCFAIDVGDKLTETSL